MVDQRIDHDNDKDWLLKYWLCLISSIVSAASLLWFFWNILLYGDRYPAECGYVLALGVACALPCLFLAIPTLKYAYNNIYLRILIGFVILIHTISIYLLLLVFVYSGFHENAIVLKRVAFSIIIALLVITPFEIWIIQALVKYIFGINNIGARTARKFLTPEDIVDDNPYRLIKRLRKQFGWAPSKITQEMNRRGILNELGCEWNEEEVQRIME